MELNSFNVKDYIVDKNCIGRGSFSNIYKCKHRITGIDYALKEIIVNKNKNTNIKHIKRELNLMKTLDHPNIVKLYDVIIDTSLHNIYFVIKYFKNGDLAKFLNGRPLKEKFCKKYLKQLSVGLEYLLKNNILHRDLKPQNILLTDEYNIQITDFGLARKINKNSMINTLCGSPMYMAPEIINKRDYNYKSDLWSVGVILYEMLHGYTPFNATNFFELIRCVNNKNVRIQKNISFECRNLILSLLEADYNKRINWEDFFIHKWFEKDEFLEKENKLLEISFNNFNQYDLQKISNENELEQKNESQFCSFIHKSVISDEHIKTNKNFDTDIKSNDDVLNHNVLNDDVLDDVLNHDVLNHDVLNDVLNHDNNDNLNLLINNTYTSEIDDESSDDNEYHSANESEHENDEHSLCSYEKSFDYEMVSPVISNFFENEDNHHMHQKKMMFLNDTEDTNKKKPGFVMINPHYMNTISLPNDLYYKKSLSKSIKDYLINSSIKILKNSYNYINNIGNNSI